MQYVLSRTSHARLPREAERQREVEGKGGRRLFDGECASQCLTKMMADWHEQGNALASRAGRQVVGLQRVAQRGYVHRSNAEPGVRYLDRHLVLALRAGICQSSSGNRSHDDVHYERIPQQLQTLVGSFAQR